MGTGSVDNRHGRGESRHRRCLSPFSGVFHSTLTTCQVMTIAPTTSAVSFAANRLQRLLHGVNSRVAAIALPPARHVVLAARACSAFFRPTQQRRAGSGG